MDIREAFAANSQGKLRFAEEASLCYDPYGKDCLCFLLQNLLELLLKFVLGILIMNHFLPFFSISPALDDIFEVLI